MSFTFSHDTKSTVKLKITITTKFKSNRSSTGYIKEAGRWKTPTFPCAFFHKITSLFIADTSLINRVNTIPPSYTLLTKTLQIDPTMHNYQHHPQDRVASLHFQFVHYVLSIIGRSKGGAPGTPDLWSWRPLWEILDPPLLTGHVVVPKIVDIYLFELTASFSFGFIFLRFRRNVLAPLNDRMWIFTFPKERAPLQAKVKKCQNNIVSIKVLDWHTDPAFPRDGGGCWGWGVGGGGKGHCILLIILINS